MKFRYVKIPDDTRPEGFISLPMLTVRLFYEGSHDDVRCLVDTGADDCMFHGSVARNLGIDLTGGRPKTYHGIGGQAVQAYLHTVDLQVQGWNERITIEAGFTDESDIPVLGQSGFFDSYEVTFRRYRRQFEVKSRTHIH